MAVGSFPGEKLIKTCGGERGEIISVIALRLPLFWTGGSQMSCR